MQFKWNLSSCTKWANKLKVCFSYCYCSKFILTSTFICNPAFHFNIGKKLLWHISFSSTCFCYCRKHPNNDLIRFVSYYLLLASYSILVTGCKYLGTNSDLVKLEWTPLFFNFNYKSVIFQIEANCFPFRLLNMLPFHIRLERLLKLIYYSLISNFSKYYFKTGTLCLLFWSSHIFTALEFDSNYFGILWKLVKPCDHNKNKPPIGKIFQKYKPIRYSFVMSWK